MQIFIYLMYMCSHICKSRNCKKSSFNTPNTPTFNHTLTIKFPLDGNCQLHSIIYNNNILTKLDLDKGSLQSSITNKFKHQPHAATWDGVWKKQFNLYRKTSVFEYCKSLKNIYFWRTLAKGHFYMILTSVWNKC